MSMGYDATASLQPLNYTTSFTNPAQWTMGNNAYLNQYSQGVLGGVLQDTQRSQQHTADLITSAAMAMPNSPGGAYMFSDTGGPAGGWGGGGGGISYQGGGYGADQYAMDNVFHQLGGGGGGLGGGSAPSIDWTHLFSGGGGGGGSGFDLGGMQNWAGNWNTPKTDPFPGMSMPGGLNSPMTMPQQQPLDYGSLFGRGAGGMGGAPQQQPYTSGIEPDQTGGRTYPGALDAPMEGAPSSSMDWSTLFSGGNGGGMSMPGGLNSPMTMQAPAYDYGSLFGKGIEGAAPSAPDGTRTYDLAPMFEGGGGGFGTGGADTSQLFGAQAPSLGGNAFSYNKDPMWQDTSPDTLAAQARARLADIIGSPETEKAVETAGGPGMRDFQSPANDYGTFQQGATPRTGYAADLDFLYQRGGHNSIIMDGRIVDAPLDQTGSFKPLSRELAARLATAARDYEAATGQRANFGEFSRGSDVQKIYWDRYQAGGGIAAPPGRSRHQGGEAGDIGRGDFRNWLQENGDTYGVHFPVRGDPVHVQMIPGYGSVFAEPDAPRPPADIPYPQGIPLPAERPAEAPARPAATPVEQGTGVNQGQEIPRPPADIPPAGLVGPGFNALDAAANAPPAPVKHSGLELARANIDTPIEKIAMERGGQKAVDQINFMAMGKTPRQLSEQYGGMFMDRAEPLFKGLGITRQDFEQAIKMSPSKQDIKMRFAGLDLGSREWPGGSYGTGPMPSELPQASPNNQYADFRRQDADIIDERGLPVKTPSLLDVGREAVDAFYPWEAQNDPAPTQLGRDLGMSNLLRQSGLDDKAQLWLRQGVTPLPTDMGPPSQGTSDATDFGSRARTSLAQAMQPKDNVVGPTSSAFGFDPGGFGEGGYGNVFEPTSDLFDQGFNALDAAADAPRSSQLAAQRAPYADTIRTDPDKSLQLAARLYSEDQNSPITRQTILEAMLNRLAATEQDPLNSGYYPKNTTQYNAALTKLAQDYDLFNQIRQEMEQPFGGSNMSDFATDWASSTLADTMRSYATPTWTSPSREQFFRKDFSTNTGSKYDTGAGIADKNRRWYESLSSPPR